jgi:hypothetical protein
MANDRKLQEDKLVTQLVPDPSQGPPDATVLSGYLGRAPEPAEKGAGASWRLYQSPALDEYVEILEADILHTQKLPDDQGTLVWVPKSLSLQHVRVHSAQVQAELLGSGSIAQAPLAATPATLTGATALPPSLGVVCSTITCPSAARVCLSHFPCPSIPCPSFTVTCPTQPGTCMSSTPSQCTHCPPPSATPSHCTLCPPITAVSLCGICPHPSVTVACPPFTHVVCPPLSVALSHCTFCPTPTANPSNQPGCLPVASFGFCPPPQSLACGFGGSGGGEVE